VEFFVYSSAGFLDTGVVGLIDGGQASLQKCIAVLVEVVLGDVVDGEFWT